MWACFPLLLRAYLVHPGLPQHSPHPTATHPFRPRIHARSVRREAPTGSPLAKSLDLVASGHGDWHDVLGCLNERYVEQGREPTARLDLGAGPLGVVGPRLPGIETVVPMAGRPVAFTAAPIPAHGRRGRKRKTRGHHWG